MADAIILLNPPRASFTRDPANSATAAANGKSRMYLEGPPTDGALNSLSRWILQSFGTQTNSNSVTAAVYQFLRNEPYYTVSPTDYNYVGMGT